MLDRGSHGFVDAGKYRHMVTEYIFNGTLPEVAPEDRAAAAKARIGEKPPQSAIEEARALRERMMANRKKG